VKKFLLGPRLGSPISVSPTVEGARFKNEVGQFLDGTVRIPEKI
jgi:hypothetical protein